MCIRDSLASQYLNELVKEKVVMKINSRPVYFLHRKKMEELYKTTFQDCLLYTSTTSKILDKEIYVPLILSGGILCL